MVEISDLVRIVNNGRNFVVYDSNQVVHPCSLGDSFKADDIDVVVGRVNNTSGDLIPNAYTQRRLENGSIFHLYFLYLDEYQKAIEVQERRIAEDLLS